MLGVRIADQLDIGDGLDDFVCIAKDGTAYASVNRGNWHEGKPPDFDYKGLWKSREGYDQANVRLEDMDGDGRADHCVVTGNGDITCWRRLVCSTPILGRTALLSCGTDILQMTSQDTGSP